jgi:hypothetical protein
MSLNQLVTAAAAATYINLQGGSARVGPALDVPFSAYDSRLDLSFFERRNDTTLDTPPGHIAKNFKFELFEDRFLRPLCGDLLQNPEHPTRKELEENFDSLTRLIAPAQQELARDPDREVLGPAHLEFYDAANELIDFISEVLTIRLNSMQRSGAISQLWAQLNDAS